MKRVIVAGTDTEIGKTVFAAGLTRALGAVYWKPVQSGLEDETDSETVRRLAALPAERILPEAYRLRTPASPHHSAKLDGVTIDPARLSPPETEKCLVIETAGGLLVPITEHFLQIEAIARWDAPVILCARTRLGTINHTLLSLEALRARRIPVLGVAFIGEGDAPAESAIIGFSGAVRLGRLPLLDPLTPERLVQAFASSFPTLSADAL